MPEIKPHCQVCEQPVRLRKDGTAREHPAPPGTRPCGGTGREPVIPPPVETPAVDPRDLAVLDGLLGDREAPGA